MMIPGTWVFQWSEPLRELSEYTVPALVPSITCRSPLPSPSASAGLLVVAPSSATDQTFWQCEFRVKTSSVVVRSGRSVLVPTTMPGVDPLRMSPIAGDDSTP